MIRSVREILSSVMPKKTLTDDELHTILLEIESIINSRPLTDVPLEPNETTPLTIIFLESITKWHYPPSKPVKMTVIHANVFVWFNLPQMNFGNVGLSCTPEQS